MLWSFEPVRRLKLFETSNKVLNTPLRAINNSDSSLCFNKPRVFGLHVGCKKLDILKILAIFWWIVLKLFGFFCKLWGNFFIFLFSFWNFQGIFPKDIFGGFFWRNFFGGIFWEKFFGRNSQWGILCLHWNWLVCQDLGFGQDFVRMEKEGRTRKDKNLDP